MERATATAEPTPHAPRRFTLRGTMAAEERIRRDVLRIAREILGAFGPRLRLAAMVGGYARGEGAIEIEGRTLKAHNDYDLIVVVEKPDLNDGFRARRAGLLASQMVGVDVDIAMVSEATFLKPPPTLFWLDVSLGGIRWIGGDARLIEQQRLVSPRMVPLDEAGRLLANRALGLALSHLGGEFGDERVLIRHGHKAVLAAGDAVLLAVDRYAPTARERADLLGHLGGVPSVGPWLVDAYHEALRFRQDAASWIPPQGDVEGWFREVCRQVGVFHMAFEAWRVGAPADPLAFAGWSGQLFRWKPDARLGDLGAGLRAWFKGVSPLSRSLLHPRERLSRAAVAIAYGGEAGQQEASKLLGLDPQTSHESLRSHLLRLRSVGS
ncbi:MAG: nucleotidyltransferase domain-containing protein [Polyangiaceae bacterium]|nr:nucleotidyltransferase domain-containing protein [Polyangiaceae bacterium]